MNKSIECIKKAPARERRCRGCGKAFMVQWPQFHKMYCSEKCSYEAALAKSREGCRRRYKSVKHDRERVCKRCGAKFSAAYTQQYCDDCINSGESYMTKLLWQRKVV